MKTTEITFITEDTHNGEVTVALNEKGELLGKHYHDSRLSWNMPTQVRYDATFEEWKETVLSYKAIR